MARSTCAIKEYSLVQQGDVSGRLSGMAVGMTVLLGVVGFVAIVGVLHLLQPEYQATRQLMSELADGRGGGAMLVAFLALAISSACAARGLSQHGSGLSIRLLLRLSSAGFVGAGAFKLSAFPIIHVVAIVAAFAGLVAVMLLAPSRSGLPGASRSRRISWGLAALSIVGVGSVGYGAPLGVVQRVSAVGILSWLLLVGVDLLRHARTVSSR